MRGRHRCPRVVHFSEHQEEFVAAARVGVSGQGHWFDLSPGSEGEDVEARKNERVCDVGSGEEEQGIGVLEAGIDQGRTNRDQMKHEVVLREGPTEVKSDSGGTGEDVGDEALGGKRTLDHCAPPSWAVLLEAAFVLAGFGVGSGCCSSQDLKWVSRLKMNCRAWLTT